MADQTFNVNCGFFDAVNDDRTYYADDMNRPYKRLVANGVFATPSGIASTDLQVSAGENRTVIVAAGEGIFADKWFENPSAISISVPAVTGLNKRIDSVLVQVDERASGRVGSIVYRTGTPASNPVPPTINAIAGVTEYRLANITVTSFGSIGQGSITDLRGSSECPWVSALIQQVDTSALWTQYQQAYQQALADSRDEFDEWFRDVENDWGTFIDQLQTDIAVTPNTLILSSSFIPSQNTTEIPIGIPSYNASTDALIVFVNGCMAKPETFWTASQTAGYITYSSGVTPKDRVDMLVLKGIVSSDLSNVQNLIQDLENTVNDVVEDTGWSENAIAFQNGASNFDDNHNKIMWRRIGDQISLRGSFKGLTGAGSVFAIPLDVTPAESLYFPSCAINNGSITANVMIQIRNDGFAVLFGINGSIGADDQIPVCFGWMRG